MDIDIHAQTLVMLSAVLSLRRVLLAAGRCEEERAKEFCGNYTPIVDKEGKDALKGVVAFEGFVACEALAACHSFCAHTPHASSVLPSVRVHLMSHMAALSQLACCTSHHMFWMIIRGAMSFEV